MMGLFLTRALILVLGYAYPAYDCYKTVELNRPEIKNLLFWCRYWILIALLTVFERIADNFISWIPMYSEAKLAFIVYLWYPKTRGTTYVYDTFFRPYIAEHETAIDRNLLELRTRAGDMTVLYFQRAASYGQTRFFEILQYVASQSQAPRTRPVQNQHQRQQQHQQQQQPVAARQVPPPTQALAHPPTRQTPLAPPSPGKSQMQAQPSMAPTAQLQASTGTSRASMLSSGASGRGPSGDESMQVDTANSSAGTESNSLPAEAVMDEAMRMTRSRLRKRMAAGGPSAH